MPSFSLRGLAPSGPTYVTQRGSAVPVGELQHWHLQPGTASADRRIDNRMCIINSEPTDRGEVEISGVAVVLEVAEPQKRAALEHEARVAHRSSNDRLQFRHRVRPRNAPCLVDPAALAARLAIQLDQSPPCRRFQIASDG